MGEGGGEGGGEGKREVGVRGKGEDKVRLVKRKNVLYPYILLKLTELISGSN